MASVTQVLFAFFLSRVYLRAFENNNVEEIRKIKCNYLLFGFASRVSIEMLSMPRLIRELQMEQNRWEFHFRLQGCPYQRQQSVYSFVNTWKTQQFLQHGVSTRNL